MKRFFYRVFCGFFLGLSVVAPGFSGSIIAIIMGIYQDIVRIAANPFKQLKQNIIFCIPLGIGGAISAVLFIIVFKALFESYEKATYLLFVGLIIGNIPIIFAEIKKREFRWYYSIGIVCTFAAALALGLFAQGISQTGDTSVITAGMLIMILSGFAGGVTALIPGMSVSMVLILFGVYRELIVMADGLLRLDFTYLIPFGVFCLSALAGLVLASNGIKFVFERFPGSANSMVLGFMSGSLIGIFIQSLRLQDASFTWLLGGIMLATGLGISMLFVVMGSKFNKDQ